MLLRLGAAGLVFVGGCGGFGLGSVTAGNTESPSASLDGGVTDANGFEQKGGGGDGGSVILEDAAADAGNKAPTIIGNPLCSVKGTSCRPDDLACYYDTATDAGSDASADAGASAMCAGPMVCASASVPTKQAACRVIGSMPTCTDYGNGGEGEACQSSSDCAATLDCVARPGATSGICKPYCCETACTSSKHEAFCNVETVLGSMEAIPVCTPVIPCSLFGSGDAGAWDAGPGPGSRQCPDSQVCTVIDPSKGVAGCISPGTGSAGDQCLTQNCGNGLACIDQVCRTLCSGDEECGGGAGTCAMLPAFYGTPVGVCE